MWTEKNFWYCVVVLSCTPYTMVLFRIDFLTFVVDDLYSVLGMTPLHVSIVIELAQNARITPS